VGAVRGVRPGADDVEVVAVPKNVGLGEVALVDEGARVFPGVGGPVVTVERFFSSLTPSLAGGRKDEDPPTP
jgi:hypothetical protein